MPRVFPIGGRGQGFPNESMDSEGREVKLKFSGGRRPNFGGGILLYKMMGC